MKTIIGQKFGQLMSKDLVKGFIMAILTVIVTFAYTSLQAGTLPTDGATWKHEAILGLSAGLAYLIKNFFTNSNDQFLTAEPKKDAPAN